MNSGRHFAQEISILCQEKRQERETLALPITSKRPLEGHSYAGFHLLKITILNNFGEKLIGILHETGSQELVILCHGFRSTKVNLLKNGPVPSSGGLKALLWESEGSFQYGNYQREVEDLHAVFLHFCSLKRKINAIVGHSKGGNVVLLYASRYHDVHTVVNISGRYALNRGIEGRLGKEFMKRIEKDGYIDVKDKTGKIEYRVTQESLMDRLATDMCMACHSIDKNCRVLTVHGSKDEVVPVEDAIEFDKIIPNHKLTVMEGANHGYSSSLAVLASTVLEFIKAGHQHGTKMPIQVLSSPKGERFLHSRF